MAQRGRGREHPVSTASPSSAATTEPILDIYSLNFDKSSYGKLEELYFRIKKRRMEAEEASVGERRELKDAVDIVGTCMGMCPDFEVLERFVQSAIDPLERGDDGLLDISRMVKRYDRGGAGAGQVPLEDIRPPPILRATVDYLMDDFLPRISMEKSHAYIRDRTRAIRKDFTRQRDFSLDAMYCHERIARFHILGLHALCRGDPNQEQQETEQLKKVLQTLTEMYQDSKGKHRSPNEAEFRAYYMLVHQRDKSALLTIRRVPQDVYCAPILQWALELRFSQSRNVDVDKRQSHLNSDVTQMNFALLFRLWEDSGTSYLMACILEGHLNDIRRSVLRLLKRSIDPGSRKVPSEELIELLRLDTEGELVHWMNALGWSIDAEGAVEVPQDQTDIPTVEGPRTPSQRLCVVKRPASLTDSQLTLGIAYNVASSTLRQRRPRDEYGTPTSIRSEKPLPSLVSLFPKSSQPVTLTPNPFASVSKPGVTPLPVASAPAATASVFKWAPDVLQSLPSHKPVGPSPASTGDWKGFGAAAAALVAKKATSGAEATLHPAKSLWSFPTNATAASEFRAASSSALESIPAFSSAPGVLPPSSTIKPPLFTWPSAPALLQHKITSAAASMHIPTPTLTPSFSLPSLTTGSTKSAPDTALAPSMTHLAPPVPAVEPPIQPPPVFTWPSGAVSAASVPQLPQVTQNTSTSAPVAAVATPSIVQPVLAQTPTAGSSVVRPALAVTFKPAPTLLATASSIPTSAPTLAPLVAPVAPLPAPVPAPAITLPVPPAPLTPQEPLYIRSGIIADQQYDTNLQHRFLRAWVSAYSSKLEREQMEDLRRQRQEQQRLEAENIALNMSLGRYDEESDTASLRHSLLGRKRKRWSYGDGDTSNPLAPHLMEEEKRRRIWQPGTFMRTIAQIARKRIRGYDIPQDWQVWTSFAPDGGSATQWFRTKLVDTHQTSDLVKVKLGKRSDMTELEEEPQPGLMILQCVPGMWKENLERAKELIEMVPEDNPFLPAFLVIMASDEGVPEWWVGDLDKILQGLILDRRAFILQSGSALATAESDFASEVDALTLDLEGIAPRLPLREVVNAFMNWWLVEFDYGAEQARSPTFDFPTLIRVVTVPMQALDKILEAVVGNCQETESPIPFNDLPSLSDVDSVYRTILEYYTEIGGEQPHSPYTMVEENPEALLALTRDTGRMVQFRLLQQEGRLRPRPGLRGSELEKIATAFDVELIQNLSEVDRSHLVYRNSPKAALPAFQPGPVSRRATLPLLKRKHSALESDTSDLDMILNGRPTATKEEPSGHVSGGRDENGEAIKRSRLTLEDLKKPSAPTKLNFRVQMAKARFDLEILKASKITEDTTEKQLWASKANSLGNFAKPVLDNVLSSSSPDNQSIIECRAIVEIMRTVPEDVFDVLRQKNIVSKSVQRLAEIQVLPGSVELRGLVEAATDLHDRLNS